MQYHKTAIFSDLDGTLFDHNGNVSLRNIESIKKYTEQGGLFAISTGRVPDNMMEEIQGVIWNAPGIILNGAAVYDPINNEFLNSVFADQDALTAVLHYALSRFPLLDLQVYTRSGILYVSSEKTVNRSFWELHRKSRFVSIEEAEQEPWYKVLLFGNKNDLKRLMDFICRERLLERFSYVYASTDIVPGVEYLELLPKNVNKGTAINYCRSLSIYSGRCFLCIGDYNNDKEMLETADISFCPKNSHPDILKICDVLVPSNNNSAVAGLIDRIPML